MPDTNRAEALIVLRLLHDLQHPSFPSSFQELVDKLAPSHFTNALLGAVYKATLSAYAAAAPENRIPTVDEVITRLESVGQTPASLHRVQDFAARAKEVRAPDVRQAVRQLLGAAIMATARDGFRRFNRTDPANAHRAAAGLAELLLTTAEQQGAQQSRADLILHDFWAKGYIPPVSTGVAPLDRALSLDDKLGGFQKGELWVIGAASGHGKSSLAVHLAAEQVRQNHGVVIHSFEMSRERLLLRMVANLGLVPYSVAVNPALITSPEEDEAVHSAVEKMGMLVRIYDQQCTMSELGQRIRRHKVEFGNNCILHIIDHFGHVDLGSDWRDSRKAIYSLAEMTVRHQITLLVFSQVDRATQKQLEETNRVVGSGSFYGTSAPFQAADVVAFLCLHNGLFADGSGYDDTMRNVSCFQIAKVRDKGMGVAYFMLRYDKRFHSYGQEVV